MDCSFCTFHFIQQHLHIQRRKYRIKYILSIVRLISIFLLWKYLSYRISCGLPTLRLQASTFSLRTIFIIVSYLYPNGLELRPETFTRDNIFVQLTKMIYSMDTPTNVLPSIHVFNSMAVYFAVKNSPKLKNNKAARTGAFVMTSLIILSTMFLKQHSVVDVLTALILSCLSYDFI